MMTPDEALTRLAQSGIQVEAAKTELVSRLLSGRVQGVAQRAFVITIGGEQTHDCMRLSRRAWMGTDIPDDFWNGADLKLPRTGDLFAAILGPTFNGAMTCVGVRFDRLGVDLIAEDHRKRKAPAPEPEKRGEYYGLVPAANYLGLGLFVSPALGGTVRWRERLTRSLPSRP